MDTLSNTNQLAREFEQKGYVIIDSGLDDCLIENVKSDLLPFFGPDRIDPVYVPYSDLGRIQDAWYINQNVMKVAMSKSIIETLASFYGQEMRPFQTLNFDRGTEQPVHSDSIHFNSEPFGLMCGVWRA